MAVYKVIQDIEAEDKLIGPLTFKKAIYALIMFAALFVAYTLAKIPPQPVWSLLALPVALGFGLLAFYPSKDQPVEVLLAAKIRFMLIPHKRIWDQTGMKELVTITVPKKIEHRYTDGLTQTEVRSRLRALATTLDSRGWAVKNANINIATLPSPTSQDTDRLVNASSLPQVVPDVQVTAADDILDAASNPTAQHFDQMMRVAAEQHKQQLVQSMQQAQQGAATVAPQPTAPQQPNNFWFMNQPSPAPQAGMAVFGTELVTPGAFMQPVAQDVSKETEQAILQEIASHKDYGNQPVHTHMKTILPMSEQLARSRTTAPTQNVREMPAQYANNQPNTKNTTNNGEQTPPPAILELASKDNDDLSVATLAKQAQHIQHDRSSDNEVIISLH
jgi:hypothetical protein